MIAMSPGTRADTERDPFDASSKGSRSSSGRVSSGELRLQLFDALFVLFLLLGLLLVVELLTSGLGCGLSGLLLSLELGENLVERATHDGTVVLGHQSVERCGVGLVGLREDGIAAGAHGLAELRDRVVEVVGTAGVDQRAACGTEAKSEQNTKGPTSTPISIPIKEPPTVASPDFTSPPSVIVR